MNLDTGSSIKGQCNIDNYHAEFLVHNKRLTLSEVDWPEDTPTNESAKIYAHLFDCQVGYLNGNNHIGTINSNENFQFDFNIDNKGNTFEGCRLKEVTIRDSSSNKSETGVELNNFNLSEI